MSGDGGSIPFSWANIETEASKNNNITNIFLTSSFIAAQCTTIYLRSKKADFFIQKYAMPHFLFNLGAIFNKLL